MMQSAWSFDNRRTLAQIGLFALCCVLATWTRAVVDADTLSDLLAILLQFATLLACAGATVITLVSALRARGRVERAITRILPVGLILLAATYVKTSYADVSIALHALTAKEDGSKTVLELGPGGRDVRLSGDIAEGAARALDKLLSTHPGVERIHLTSGGGLVDEGEALRKVIAAHKLTTFVPDYCVSACTLAFVGGRERLMMENARLGFHAPFAEGLFDQTFAGDNSAERAIYQKAGVTPDFVDEAFKVKPDDIWTPESQRLIAAGVVTGIVDRYRFPDSNLDGTATPSGARATVLRNFPLARALDGRKPQVIDIIAAWYVDAYRRGLSEGAIVDDLTTIIDGAASLAMTRADDDTMIGFGRFIDSAMEVAGSDEACEAIGGKASLIEAEAALNEDDDQAGAEGRAMSLLTQALTTGRSSAAMSPAHQGPESAHDAMSLSEHLACDQIKRIYAHALRLPPRDAAAILRSLLAQSSQETPLASAVVGVAFH